MSSTAPPPPGNRRPASPPPPPPRRPRVDSVTVPLPSAGPSPAITGTFPKPSVPPPPPPRRPPLHAVGGSAPVARIPSGASAPPNRPAPSTTPPPPPRRPPGARPETAERRISLAELAFDAPAPIAAAPIAPPADAPTPSTEAEQVAAPTPSTDAEQVAALTPSLDAEQVAAPTPSTDAEHAVVTEQTPSEASEVAAEFADAREVPAPTEPVAAPFPTDARVDPESSASFELAASEAPSPAESEPVRDEESLPIALEASAPLEAAAESERPTEPHTQLESEHEASAGAEPFAEDASDGAPLDASPAIAPDPALADTLADAAPKSEEEPTLVRFATPVPAHGTNAAPSVTTDVAHASPPRFPVPPLPAPLPAPSAPPANAPSVPPASATPSAPPPSSGSRGFAYDSFAPVADLARRTGSGLKSAWAARRGPLGEAFERGGDQLRRSARSTWRAGRRAYRAFEPRVRARTEVALAAWNRMPPQRRIAVGAAAALSGAILLLLLVVRGEQAAEQRNTARAVESVQKAESAKARVSKSDLEAAVQGGVPELSRLLERAPNDPEVLVALASKKAEAGDFEGALSDSKRALAADTKIADSKKLAGVLWRAAQSDASAAAFDIMNGLDRRGADIQYDLATTPEVRADVRARALEALGSARFAESATEDTRLAAALFRAPSCAEKRALLEHAADVGDRRTLNLLRAYQSGAACKLHGDAGCAACLRDGRVLDKTVEKLSHRVKP